MVQNIKSPAGFVPGVAISFGADGAAATMVTASDPLPTRAVFAPAATPPLAGMTSASAMLGPFAPEAGRPIMLTLSGSWSGSVQMLRSADGGVTRLPLTYSDGSAKPVWTAALNAVVAEEMVAGATYYLGVTMTTGTLAYRMEQ